MKLKWFSYSCKIEMVLLPVRRIRAASSCGEEAFDSLGARLAGAGSREACLVCAAGRSESRGSSESSFDGASEYSSGNQLGGVLWVASIWSVEACLDMKQKE